MTGLLLVLCLSVIYVTQKLLAHWCALKSVGNHPGYRTLLPMGTVLDYFLPRMRGIIPGSNHYFVTKHSMFEEAGWDIHTAVSFWPRPNTSIVLGDAAAIKEVGSSRARFPKPVQQYASLALYGPNIVASEGEQWKKYRKIAAPAFSDRNNKLVWNETSRIVNGLFETVWDGRDVVTVDHCLDITLPIALFVIGSAGFGKTLDWKEETVLPPGHKISFKEALHTVTTRIFLRLICPNWILNMTEKGRETRQGFEELGVYMSEMVKERLTSEKVERHDLFSSLLASNNHEFDASTLTEEELVGNIFIFLVAGHETTAHTLCFAFALLALYPEEQETLYQHIKSVLPGDRQPEYEDMSLLTQSMAVFYETMRLFPPVIGIPKFSAEDTILEAGNINGEKKTVVVPKGARVVISAPGVHYNPRYWEDPHEFKPSRFLKDWPRDAFVPFSVGARACLGRKFFETEGIAILTILISKYKITVKEEPQFAGETFEQKKARLLKSRAGITLTPIRVPLVFTRRI